LSNNNKNVLIRPLEISDNIEIAKVIRCVLKEHGVDRPGTVYTDPTTDNLYQLFRENGAAYFVAEYDGKIVGGCGIYPTKGLPEGHAELVKLYLLPEYRGMGLGKRLMEVSIEFALKYYSALYLETMPELANAIDLYRNLGFEPIPERLGESGHFSCNIWMTKQLV